MHPVVKDAETAATRCRTLARRLRYKGDVYNADIAECELLPWLNAQTKPTLADLPRSMGGDGM